MRAVLPLWSADPSAGPDAHLLADLVTASATDGPPWIWVAVLGLFGVVSAVVSLQAWFKKWVIDDTPTSTCRGVFLGRNEVVGRAVPIHQPLTSPFTSTPSVWFEWHLERYHSDDDGGSWQTVEKRSTCAPFWIEDATGRILVRPRDARMDVDGHTRNTLGRNYAPPYSRWQLRQWVLVGEDALERHESLQDRSFWEPPEDGGWFKASTSTPLADLRGRHRVTERVFPAGHHVYLLGHARERPDLPGLEFTARAGRLLVSTKQESDIARRKARKAVLSGLVSLVLLAAAAAVASMQSHDELRPSWPIAVMAVMLLGLLILTLVRNYNRQVRVKEQASKAWSMIEVSLQRRAELLPELARVAEGYLNHEGRTQTVLAELRQGWALPVHEELPAEASMVTVESSDRAQRSVAADAFAIAEAHPALRGDAVFSDLQRRIVDAEEAVASARVFYNEAINVLRDRRQQFPGSVFASMVDVPTWRLFEAEEAARATPPVAIAPSEAAPHQPAHRPAPPQAHT